MTGFIILFLLGVVSAMKFNNYNSMPRTILFKNGCIYEDKSMFAEKHCLDTNPEAFYEEGSRKGSFEHIVTVNTKKGKKRFAFEDKKTSLEFVNQVNSVNEDG